MSHEVLCDMTQHNSDAAMMLEEGFLALLRVPSDRLKGVQGSDDSRSEGCLHFQQTLSILRSRSNCF